jgi:hypothetical protein
MKIISKLSSIIMAGLIICGGSGCGTFEEHSLTSKLWNSQAFRSFSEPSSDPKLALFQPALPEDILVEYDAVSDRSEPARRRAYFLEANRDRILAGQKPRFVDPALSGPAVPIPLLDHATVETNPPVARVFAVTNSSGRSFLLYRASQPAQAHTLPMYEEHSGTSARIALTPFAIAGDATVVGLVLAVIGACALGESNAHFH